MKTRNNTTIHKFLFFTLSLVVLLSLQSFQVIAIPSDPTVLNPTKDCYILYDYNENGYMDINYNGNDLTIGYSGYGYRYNTLIAFDLSSISYVNTATLRLYITSFAGVLQSVDYNISCITQTWDESTATWYNSENNYNLIPETIFTYTKLGTPGWYEIDLTNTVKNWVAGTVDNFGIRIHTVIAGGNNCNIDSREATNPPQQVIDQTIVAEGNYVVIIPIILITVLIIYYRKQKC